MKIITAIILCLIIMLGAVSCAMPPEGDGGNVTPPDSNNSLNTPESAPKETDEAENMDETEETGEQTTDHTHTAAKAIKENEVAATCEK